MVKQYTGLPQSDLHRVSIRRILAGSAGGGSFLGESSFRGDFYSLSPGLLVLVSGVA